MTAIFENVQLSAPGWRKTCLSKAQLQDDGVVWRMIIVVEICPEMLRIPREHRKHLLQSIRSLTIQLLSRHKK